MLVYPPTICFSNIKEPSRTSFIGRCVLLLYWSHVVFTQPRGAIAFILKGGGGDCDINCDPSYAERILLRLGFDLSFALIRVPRVLSSVYAPLCTRHCVTLQASCPASTCE